MLEKAAIDVLVAMLRHCRAFERDANCLLPPAETEDEDVADGADPEVAAPMSDGEAAPHDDDDDDDANAGKALPPPTTASGPAVASEPPLPSAGSIVQAVYSRRWQPATVVGGDERTRVLEVTFFGYHDVVALPPDRWARMDRKMLPNARSAGPQAGDAGSSSAPPRSGGGGAASAVGSADEPRPRTHESPLHLACWRGSRAAVEMLLIAGADLFAPAASGLLPIHVACDRRAPAYPRNGGDAAFVPWVLGQMQERDESGGGAPDVQARLRTTVPSAFWRRGCDPDPLGIAEEEEEAASAPPCPSGSDQVAG